MCDRASTAILLVEDSSSYREAVRAALMRAGYRVDAAATGTEAMERYGGGGYDVLLSDVVLPDVPGIDLLAHVRQVNPDQCVILMTSEGSGLSAAGVIRAGADDYLLKPMRLDDDGADLEVIISRSLERRRLAKENKELQAKLVEASKLNAVMSLAGAAAHEMNQPLTVMAGITELLMMDADPDDPAYQDYEALRRAAQRLCDIVAKLGAVTAYRTKPYVGDTTILDLERSAAET